MRAWRIGQEPKGGVYTGLIGWVAARSDRVTFYLDDIRMEPSALRLVDALAGSLTDVREVHETSGSTLAAGTVMLHEYQVTHEATELITRATDRLYAWQEPELPNELCFTTDARQLLTVLASDRLAYMSLTDGEHGDLMAALPDLRLRPMR